MLPKSTKSDHKKERIELKKVVLRIVFFSFFFFLFFLFFRFDEREGEREVPPPPPLYRLTTGNNVPFGKISLGQRQGKEGRRSGGLISEKKPQGSGRMDGRTRAGWGLRLLGWDGLDRAVV